MPGLPDLEQPPELIDSETRVPQDVPQRAGPDVTACVNRNGRSPAVWMTHDVVATVGPADDEPRLLQCVHYLAAPYRGNRRHQATSRTVIVSSSGIPNSANQPSSASRRSATASSGVCPSPLAPPPGNDAWAHHQPVSSCSTLYGTCTTRSTVVIVRCSRATSAATLIRDWVPTVRQHLAERQRSRVLVVAGYAAGVRLTLCSRGLRAGR